MNCKRSDSSGYEKYYLRENPPEAEYYLRKARGYHRRFRRLLDGENISSCLDLACATGLLANYLRQRVCSDVVGVDTNAELIEIARRNVSAQFVADDAVHYTRVCGRKFDAVFLLDILEHLDRRRVTELLVNVRGLLNEGRFAIVRVPNMNCIHAAGAFYGDWTHSTPFTERTLGHVAELAGFTRVEFCGQFRMQNFKGKLKACVRTLLTKALFWLRGGHKVKVCYPNIVAKLYK
ncbi:MAG: class I SAM-dependent methyltransferase [Planctomycetota bacterium]